MVRLLESDWEDVREKEFDMNTKIAMWNREDPIEGVFYFMLMVCWCVCV